MIMSEWQLPYLVQQLELAPNILDGLENTSLLLYLDAKHLTRHDAPAACIPNTVVVAYRKSYLLGADGHFEEYGQVLQVSIFQPWVGAEANDQKPLLPFARRQHVPISMAAQGEADVLTGLDQARCSGKSVGL
jgi:hypothetical protein